MNQPFIKMFLLIYLSKMYAVKEKNVVLVDMVNY